MQWEGGGQRRQHYPIVRKACLNRLFWCNVICDVMYFFCHGDVRTMINVTPSLWIPMRDGDNAALIRRGISIGLAG